MKKKLYLISCFVIISCICKAQQFPQDNHTEKDVKILWIINSDDKPSAITLNALVDPKAREYIKILHGDQYWGIE